jgi:uncharacterized integral membrane protein
MNGYPGGHGSRKAVQVSRSAQVRFLIALIGLVLLIVIGVQNSETVELRLLFWTVSVDRALLFLLLFVAGVVGGMLLSWWYLHRDRKSEPEES